MKRNIAFVGQIALVALIISGIYFSIFSTFPEKIQMAIETYYDPQIPESILTWSETVSGLIYLLISSSILVIMIRKGWFEESPDEIIISLIGLLIAIFVPVLIYCYLAADISGTNDPAYHYKQLLLIGGLFIGIGISLVITFDDSENDSKTNKILMCSVVPLIHSYLLLPFGFTASLATAVGLTLLYYFIGQTVLTIYRSYKRLGSYQ